MKRFFRFIKLVRNILSFLYLKGNFKSEIMKNLSLLIIACCFSIFTYANSSKATPIHVQVSGKGEPILFIPGFTVPGEIWNPIVKELSNTYECHVVTLAGFGGTQPIEFPWLPKVNQAIESYIKDNQLKDVTVIGHSLGGTVATWLGAQNDNAIKELILVDALPCAGALMIPDFDPEHLAYDSPYNNQQLEMDDTQFEQMATMMSSAMSLDTTAQQKIKNWIIQSDRKTYVYGYTDYLKLDLRKELNNIRMPVTIIAATQPYGETMVRQTNQTQYENLETYNLILAQDAAHFIMLDQPEWFMEQIKQLLAID